VAYGELLLERLILGSIQSPATVQASLQGREVPATVAVEGGAWVVHFPEGVKLLQGQELVLKVGRAT